MNSKLGGNHLTQRKTEVYNLVEYHKGCGRQKNEFRLQETNMIFTGRNIHQKMPEEKNSHQHVELYTDHKRPSKENKGQDVQTSIFTQIFCNISSQSSTIPPPGECDLSKKDDSSDKVFQVGKSQHRDKRNKKNNTHLPILPAPQ